ncbi:hypothetical protein STEG23_013889, partial [Scotinomys teguina]
MILCFLTWSGPPSAIQCSTSYAPGVCLEATRSATSNSSGFIFPELDKEPQGCRAKTQCHVACALSDFDWEFSYVSYSVEDTLKPDKRSEGPKMSTEAQRVDDSPSTSGGSSDGDQRESVQQEPEREQVQPKKKEGKISSKTAAKLSTSAKRIQKELAEITLDPPPNC